MNVAACEIVIKKNFEQISTNLVPAVLVSIFLCHGWFLILIAERCLSRSRALKYVLWAEMSTFTLCYQTLFTLLLVVNISWILTALRDSVRKLVNYIIVWETNYYKYVLNNN